MNSTHTKVKKERNNYIDFVKGLLMILVIAGHAIQYILSENEEERYFNNILFKIIYTFHMPLFIAVSGYFTFYSLQKASIVSFIKNRIKYLLIPMIVWCIFISISNFIFSDYKSVFLLGKSFIAAFIFQYWFLWAILFYSVLFAFIFKIKQDNWKTLIIVLLLFTFIPNINFYPINVIFGFTSFFTLGYLIAKYNLFKYSGYLMKTFYSLLILYIIGVIFWTHNTYIYNTPGDLYSSYIDLYRTVVGIVGCVVFMIIFYKLHNIIQRYRLTSLIEKTGTNSLSIYLIQGLIYFIIALILERVNLSFEIRLIVALAIVISSIYWNYLISFIEKKSKWGAFLLFGKR